MALGDEIDEIFRREVKVPARLREGAGRGWFWGRTAVEEMNRLLMGLVVAVQGSLHLLADRIEDMENP